MSSQTLPRDPKVTAKPAPRDPKSLEGSAGDAQVVSKGPQKVSKGAPKTPRSSLDGPQDYQKSFQVPSERPRWSSEEPRAFILTIFTTLFLHETFFTIHCSSHSYYASAAFDWGSSKNI